VLRYEEWPDPEPGDGKVLVRVEVAGVNHYDITMRAAMASQLPTVLGLDAAGRREDTGERVMVSGAPGCYAELVAASEDAMWPIPDELEAVTAAALGVAYRTAWWDLVDVAGLKEGETLLVQAAASGTGMASVDVARALGAKVYATARAEKLDRVRALGAEALAYDDAKVEELGANVVFDPVGADTWSGSIAALAPGGRLVTPGAVSSPEVTMNLWPVIGKSLRILGAGSASPARDVVARMIEMAARGELRPVVDRVLPLAEAAEAHRAIEARETFGKVLLRP
jgi:NADPH2:quinone reductase